jgi:hypothetical protein
MGDMKNAHRILEETGIDGSIILKFILENKVGSCELDVSG